MQMESAVGGNSSPQILLMIFRNNIVSRLHRILSVHKLDRSSPPPPPPPHFPQNQHEYIDYKLSLSVHVCGDQGSDKRGERQV